MPEVVIKHFFFNPITILRAGGKNKDHQIMMVDPMFMSLFLTAVTQTAVAPTAVFL